MRPGDEWKRLAQSHAAYRSKAKSESGILTCRMFHPVTRDSPGTVLFLVLRQRDSSVSPVLPDLVIDSFSGPPT